MKGLSNTMQIHEHRGFSIEVHRGEEGYISEVYRKGKLIHTVRHDDSKFYSHALAVEAAREWRDRTYPPGRIKYFGECN
jgi:archaeosine-15-forming tRNA-guanine transglycosylase